MTANLTPPEGPLTSLTATIDAQHNERLSMIQREWRRSLVTIAGGMALFLLVTILTAWFANQIPNLPLPRIGEVRNLAAVGSVDLCPGDFLTYTYEWTASGPGVFELDHAVYRVAPFEHVHSEPVTRLVLDRPMSVPMRESWQIPDFVDWTPGSYRRVVAITTSSRSTQPSLVGLNFTIREDCRAAAMV